MTYANDLVATKHGGRSHAPRNPEVERFTQGEAASKPQSGPAWTDRCQLVEGDADLAAARASAPTFHDRRSTSADPRRDVVRDVDDLKGQLRRARAGAA
jgi:hypothetical protein